MVTFGEENVIPKTTNRKMFIFRKQIAKENKFLHTHTLGVRERVGEWIVDVTGE